MDKWLKIVKNERKTYLVLVEFLSFVQSNKSVFLFFSTSLAFVGLRDALADEAEEKAKEEWRQKAKKELDDWYKHHAEQLEKTRENNRYLTPVNCSFVLK